MGTAGRVRGAAEGGAYAIPLPSGGYATVVVARVAPAGGIALGYFFGPRAPNVPEVGSLDGLRADVATRVAKFGDMGIVEGKWPRIGRVPGWDRRKWPTPKFKRRSPIDGRVWRVEYHDDDPNSTPREVPIDEVSAAALPDDALHGDVAIERVLDLEISKGAG